MQAALLAFLAFLVPSAATAQRPSPDVQADHLIRFMTGSWGIRKKALQQGMDSVTIDSPAYQTKMLRAYQADKQAYDLAGEGYIQIESVSNDADGGSRFILIRHDGRKQTVHIGPRQYRHMQRLSNYLETSDRHKDDDAHMHAAKKGDRIAFITVAQPTGDWDTPSSWLAPWAFCAKEAAPGQLSNIGMLPEHPLRVTIEAYPFGAGGLQIRFLDQRSEDYPDPNVVRLTVLLPHTVKESGK